MTESRLLRILFLANNPTFKREMDALAQALRPIAMTTVIGASESNASSKLKKKTIRSGLSALAVRLGGLPKWWTRKRFAEKIQKHRVEAANIIAKGWDLVFVSGDRNPETIEGALLQECKRLGIPTVVAPVCTLAEKHGLLRCRRGIPAYYANFALHQKYDEIIVNDPTNSKWISFYPVNQLDVLDREGLLSPNPWVVGNGLVNYVFTTSPYWLSRLVRAGASIEKLIFTGHLAFDRIVETTKRRHEIRIQLVRKYQLDEGKEWLVVAPPPLGEHSLSDRHKDEIEFLGDSMLEFSKDVQVLVSLHPKMRAADYQDWANKFHLHIIEEPLHEWLVAGKYFCASFSSTVDWAIGLGMPVLIFDFYDLNYDFYDNEKDVEIVFEKRNFPLALRNLLSKKIEKGLAYNAGFDGKASTRICENIQAIVRKVHS